MVPHHCYVLCWTLYILAVSLQPLCSYCFHYLIVEINHFSSFPCVLGL